MKRMAEVTVSFHDLTKGTTFDYDPSKDEAVMALIRAGLVHDLGEVDEDIQVVAEGTAVDNKDIDTVANPTRTKASKKADTEAA